MRRIFSPSQNISADKIIISDKSQLHHLRDVLRLKRGDNLIIFDEEGNEYNSAIEEISSATLTLRIKSRNKITSGKIRLTVACAIPKKSKFDDIIDKLTQLGADRIIPMLTERVIIKLDKNKMMSRLERWEKIALSASQQSQRNNLPVIGPVKRIKEVLAESGDFDLKLIPALAGERKSLKEVLVNSKPKNILVLIGPEGDFTNKEIDLAKEAGCIPISLGCLVLRVETAAIAAASFIRLLFNNK